jgi:hypothetical protein
MLRSINDLHRLVVEGIDGSIGRINDLYFDDQAWTIRFLVVETGAWLEGRKVLISPFATHEPDWKRLLLPVSVKREQVRKSPNVDSRRPVSRQHEIEHAAYCGYPYYWGGAGIWGDGMRPRMMLAACGGAESAEAQRQETEFVQAQADAHRRRGDDPHLRSTHAMIRYHIHATDGEVGHVDGMIIDDETWTIRYLVVNTSDWWLGHQVLVAPPWITDISWLEATVSVDLSRDAIKRAPAYNHDALPDREQERRMYEHYVRPGDRAEQNVREIELAPREVRVTRDVPVPPTGTKTGHL